MIMPFRSQYPSPKPLHILASVATTTTPLPKMQTLLSHTANPFLPSLNDLTFATPNTLLATASGYSRPARRGT
jgi:hypothetical protein